jgi:hypothetical protein
VDVPFSATPPHHPIPSFGEEEDVYFSLKPLHGGEI